MRTLRRRVSRWRWRRRAEAPRWVPSFLSSLRPVCEGKHGGVGPFAFFELRGNGIEDGSKNDEVGAGMFCQQTRELVVVPDAVPGRAQFLEGYGRGVGIGGQSLPDEGVRTLRETLQHNDVFLGMRQCEVFSGRGHEDGLSGWSEPSSCHRTLPYPLGHDLRDKS